MTALHQNTVAQQCPYCDAECLIEFGCCHCGCGRKTNLCPRNDRPRRWIKGFPQKFLKGHTDIERPRQHAPMDRCICGELECKIPYGFCHCGCGEMAPLAVQTSVANKRFRGEPTRFIKRHAPTIRPSIEEAKPFKIDGVYCRLIPLSRGLYTIVWESDYLWLMQWKWCAEFNPLAGCFYAGRTAKDANGKKTHIFMHRLILGLSMGDPREGDHVYHKNSLDNRRSNLRITDQYGQSQNKGKRVNNTSGYKGVSWDDKRSMWIAQIVAHGQWYFLGAFSAREAAYAAYCAAAIRLHGEFACLA